MPLFDPWDSYIVPPFPIDVLPASVRQFVETQSKVIGCDASALAVAALANFSAALDHRFALKMLRNGDWYATPRLWVLLVGDPSRKKTPIIKAATFELDKIQGELWDAWERERDEAKKLDPDCDDPPRPPRFVVGDTTTEKLGEILSRHDRGLLVKRDEFAGWIGAMEKYGRAGKGASADRAFWLQAFDGGPFTVDRISRGELRIKNLSVSLLGGIQPDRLREMHGLTSDGLLQRFLPVMVGPGVFPADVATGLAAASYASLTRGLVNARPASVIMADDAYAAAESLRRELHDLEQVGAGLAQGFQAFVGKLAGLFGSLALVLHMIRDPHYGNVSPVECGTVAGAARIVTEFVLPHAFEFYRAAERASDGDRLQRIASFILTAGKSRLVASDLTSGVAHLRGQGLFDLNRQVSPLVAGGWLLPEEDEPTARAWKVAPAVFEQLEARRRAERERKQALVVTT